MAVSRRPYARVGVTNNPDGRPEFVPTDEQRSLVIVMAGLKVPQRIMAEKLGNMDHKTLTKHFSAEIEHGRENLIASLKAQIVQQAMRGSVRATTWLLERLDPEQFAPRYQPPPDPHAAAIVPLMGVDAKVEVYLPDNGRSASEAVERESVVIDAVIDR